MARVIKARFVIDDESYPACVVLDGKSIPGSIVVSVSFYGAHSEEPTYRTVLPIGTTISEFRAGIAIDFHRQGVEWLKALK